MEETVITLAWSLAQPQGAGGVLVAMEEEGGLGTNEGSYRCLCQLWGGH